jgi:hypothetical protein
MMPGLNAAFVNVGYEKDAFLHYLDLGAHFSSYSTFLKQLLGDEEKKGKLPDVSRMKPTSSPPDRSSWCKLSRNLYRRKGHV